MVPSKIKIKINVIISSMVFSSLSLADSAFDLGRIEVTAEKSLPGVATNTVDSETLREENRQTVAEAVDRIPGVTLSNLGSRSEVIANVRGFDLRQIPVLIDGIPVYVPYDGYVDLSRFTTFDVSEISVSKSFTSTLIGPNALGGAINLVSRRPTETLEGEIGAGYRTGDNSNSDGKRTWLNLGTNQKIWYGQFSASYLQDDAFSLSDDFKPTVDQPTGVRENSARKDTKVNIKLGLTPNDTDEYAIGYVKQDGEKNTPPYAGDTPDVRARYRQWPYWDKESVYFLSNTALSSISYLKTRLFFDSFDNQLQSFDDSTYTTQTRRYAFNSVYNDETYGASIEYGHTLGNHQLKFAAHYKFDEHIENDIGEPESKFQDRTLSFGFEDTITLSDRLFLVMGASYDKRKILEAFKYFSDNGGGFERFDHNENDAFNPQIGLFAELNEANDARITLSHKTRFATIKDRYSGSFGSRLPNEDLDSEQSTTLELGWVHKLKDFGRLEATAFYSDIEDLIQEVALPKVIIDENGLDSDAGQLQNVGEVRSRGIELAGDFWLGDWQFGGNYSYLDRDNLASDLKLTNVPEHKVFGYVTWQLTQPLSISVTSQYESERVNDTEGIQRSDSFVLAGLRTTYQHPQGFIARIGVENLFDRNYSYDEGYPEAGRTYYANLSYQF